MAADIIFNQVGLTPVATNPGARTDGLQTGGRITVRNSTGRDCSVQLLWIPPGDSTALASLTQAAGDTWEFDPTAAVAGTFKVKLTEDIGLPSENSIIRVFAIRTAKGLVLPALNEAGDRNVSLASSIAEKEAAARASNNNESYAGLDYLGWWGAIDELIRYVDAINIPATLPLPDDVYINDLTGNDNAAGTIGAPLKTFAGLVARFPYGVVPKDLNVFVYPHATAYEGTELGGITGYLGHLRFFGVGTATLGGTGTVTAVSGSTAAKLQVAGSTWTADQVYGYHLRCDSGPNAGLMRTILRNDDNEAWFHEFPSAIGIGNQFTVTRPTVKVRWTRELSVFGGNRTATYASDSRFLSFINFEFQYPNDFIGMSLTGRCDFYGIIMTSTASVQCVTTFTSAYVRAGNTTFVDAYGPSYDDQKIVGWGISQVGVSKHITQIENSVADLAGCVLESAQLRPGAWLDVQSGTFATYDVQPHGAISMNASVIYFFGVSTTFIRSDGAAYASLLVETGSQVEIVGPVTQYGSATAPLIVRYPASAIFNLVQPTLTGAVTAFNGAKVRLVGVDGSTVAGGFQAGYGGPTAASFPLAGDYISAADDSSVYRSA
jgi:hypothetical protein